MVLSINASHLLHTQEKTLCKTHYSPTFVVFLLKKGVSIMASSEDDISARFAEVEHFVDRFLSAACDASRRHILEYLSIASENDPDPNLPERSVGDIAAHLGLALSTTSEHLKELLQLHLLGTRKDGKKIYYSLRNRELVRAFHKLVDALTDHYRQNIHHPSAPLEELE